MEDQKTPNRRFFRQQTEGQKTANLLQKNCTENRENPTEFSPQTATEQQPPYGIGNREEKQWEPSIQPQEPSSQPREHQPAQEKKGQCIGKPASSGNKRPKHGNNKSPREIEETRRKPRGSMGKRKG
ncbi:hypothetical protein KFK09_022895 [Dendrobium nobile]|uniref:Uncharacterized protein n=1 Tax=Dendrobium nobile TaxID=94219 RepID=A0A8T3AR54_DENNO|nr:hypothetical protein KFK09_022895 [Dendrobium nobile]